MASRKRIDIEKCEDFVRFEELEGGDVALSYFLSANCQLQLGRKEEEKAPLTILQKMQAAEDMFVVVLRNTLNGEGI